MQVLKKADMIRKNAVESILAERDILISVQNPFVVSYCDDQSFLFPPPLDTDLFFFHWGMLVQGTIFLFFHISGEPIPCDGVLEWRGLVFIAEKFRLP